MNFEKTFTPYKIGNVMIKNRLVVPAMDSGEFTPEGFVRQATLDYYGARAAGGFGLIIIEISAVERRGVGMPHEPALWTDECIPGMTTLANHLKNNGTRTIVQLHHAGRETVAAMAGEQIAAPSSVPCPTNRETPHEFSTQEVYDLIQHYVDAAVRCYKAGFDGVEIHASHGYMGGQFLSPRSNKRIDEFGGGLDGRAYTYSKITLLPSMSRAVFFVLIQNLNRESFLSLPPVILSFFFSRFLRPPASLFPAPSEPDFHPHLLRTAAFLRRGLLQV